MSRSWKWVGLAAVVLTLPIVAIVAMYDATRLKGAVTALITEKTGRPLAIDGDLQWSLDWPQVRVRAIDVTFANPSWAREKQMLTAASVDLSIDLPRLLGGRLFVPEVRLERPVIFFERSADGRKNWLLDQEQRNDTARVAIGRLTVDHGRVGYDDPTRQIRILAEISTANPVPATTQGSAADPGIVFKASGKYRGLPLTASGNGGAVLELYDDSAPYRLSVVATVGPTSVRAAGTVTSLLERSAVDLELVLRGGSLAELFDVLDIALPETRAYSITGHLTHSANLWRYDEFSGRIGQSDVTGSLRLNRGAARPFLEGALAFKSLNLGDLGPVVGADTGSSAPQADRRTRTPAVRAAGTGSRVLPAIPFSRDRWTTVDADVSLKARTILRPKALPLEHLTTRLRMRESVLTLDPFDVGAAGGHLDGVIRLDGQQSPIQARAKMGVRKLLLAKLLPTIALGQDSVGAINGEIELVGRGDSIARMLSTADGKVGLVINGGKISKLLMEQVALHVPEMMLLKISGDKLVDIRCGVADFNVEHGIMKVDALVFDTEPTKIVGTGSLDLEKETLNLTLVPSAKRASAFALRGPIYVRGDLAHPAAALDAGHVGGRSLAALALGAINPALSLLALADPGSGQDSDCSGLIREAQAPWRKAASRENHAAEPAAARN